MTDKQIIIKEITECGFYCSKDDTERLYIYEVIKNTDKEWLKENPEATLLIDEWLYDYTDYDDRKVYCTSGNLINVCNASTCEVYKIEDTKYKIYGNCGQFLIEDKPTYKEQLKRTEAQCEDMFVKHTDLEIKYKHKEQECEELKEKLENHCFDCDVAERMAKVTYAATGGRLSYSNYTVEAIEQAYNDQLRIDVEYRTKELEQQLDQLKAENDNLKSLIWWIHIGAEGADKATTEYYENRNTPYEENYWKRIRALQPPTYESKYKLALTEIKEIAENAAKCLYVTKSDDYTDGYRWLGSIILQKISEVIKNE